MTEVSGGLALSGDASLSVSSGRVFVCDRTHGQVHEIDPAGPSIVRTFAASRVGEGDPDPYDVAVDEEGRLWIARYNLPSIAVLGPDGAWIGEVDLSAFDPEDGIPEATAIAIVGGTAYVALERIPHGSEVTDPPPGLVVPIATVPPFTVGVPIELTGGNPFGRLTPVGSPPDSLLVLTPGSWSTATARDGVERVDLAAGTSATIVNEIALGGSATDALVVAEDEAYAIAAGTGEGNATRLVRFDPSRGSVGAPVANAAGFDYWGLAATGAAIVIGDTTPQAEALRWFDRASGAEIAKMELHHAPPRSVLALAH